MDYHNLDEFKSEIELLEAFFTEFAAREDEILTWGMKRVSKWESYLKAAPHLKNFESKINEFEKFLRPVDKRLYEKLISLLNDSKLLESISGIEVSLRIASARQKLSAGSEIASGLMFHLPYISNLFRRKKLFSEDVIPIQKLIVALGRLSSLISIAGDTYIRQWNHDSDVFKPANLDSETIISLIESAISDIETKSNLSTDEKKQLIEYLYKAKSELAEERPSWNKVVGALVIAAAITSGISDASGAYHNIDAAIKYILGTSIEKHAPNRVPLLNKDQEKEPDPMTAGGIRV